MSVSDIEGSRPAEKKHSHIKTRNILDVTDIEGAVPAFGHEIPQRKEGFGRSFNYDPMNYRDVTHNQFVSSRHCNPLMPKYTIKDENKNTIMIGEVQGSKPQALPPKRMDKNFQQISLTTNDIQGCAAGTGNLGNFHTRDRKDIREINLTKDIVGA